MESLTIKIDIFFDDEDEELDKPTEDQVQEWIEFKLGLSFSLRDGNPMEEIDMHEDVDYSLVTSKIN